MLEIQSLETGNCVVIKVNDRLPVSSKIDIDLSKEAFNKIDNLNKGKIKVHIKQINVFTDEKK